MTITTTPEVIEPNQLQAYDGFDFTEILAGGAPNGQDCLRWNHAANSNRQNLWQPNDVKFMQAENPAEPSLSFWIRRLQAFDGTATNWSTTGGYVAAVAPGTNGGMIFGVGDATAPNMSADYPSGWSFWGTNTDDLFFALQYRASGSNDFWFTFKVDDLPLNEWRHVVLNLGAQWATTSSPANKLLEAYINGRKTFSFGSLSYSSSSGGTYPIGFIYPDRATWGIPTSRFAIGDPTFGQTALRGAGNGPLIDLAQISFHTTRLTQSEVFALYESMIYGG